MDLTLIDTLIRIAVPFLVTWNVFLFTQSQRNKDNLHHFQLHVAENYIGKADLEKMIQRLEERLEKQLNSFFKTISRGE
ncbi:hypothetical protein [Endozoicomonas sp. YOMI1]|uniref:hypothetical protein n=1 Tax=Endozoicomonas sp. YOMI1 TaxID=2828739 RepID=UPI002148A047|nr:hypothetical protein [Endozoicomonas sp. YOMI1]